MNFEDSCRIMNHGLASTELLRESQKENVRLKAADLWNRREEWESTPFRLLFEFNARCNTRCVHCTIDHSPKEELTPEVLEALLDEIGWGVMEIMPLLRGEPTLAPLHDIAPLLRRHNIYIILITNGLLLTRSYFLPIADITSRVQFSLHTHRRDMFNYINPEADFDAVVRNIRDAAEVAGKTGTHIVTCICPMKDMLDHMEEYVSFVAELGVKRIVVQKLFPQTARYQELDPFQGRDMDEVEGIWRNVLKTAGEAGVHLESNYIEIIRGEKTRMKPSKFDFLQENAYICDLFHPGFCISTAINVVVEYDGTVIPCVYDHIVLGNLHENRFGEIWNGEPMRALRRAHFGQSLRTNCRACKGFHNFD